MPASFDIASLLPTETAPVIGGESCRSLTLTDRYWIANAVLNRAARSTLLADLKAAHDAERKSSKHTALKKFSSYAKRHLHGELSTLLQTAVRPLLG